MDKPLQLPPPVISSDSRDLRPIDPRYPNAWRKGQSGNPGGRPSKPLSEKLLKELSTRNGKRALAIAKAILSKAEKGDVGAFVAVRDTVEGKPVQRIDGEQSIAITIERIGD